MSFFPVACFTCRKRIAHLYEPYLALIGKKEDGNTIDERAALDKLKIIRPCCRRMFTTHADVEKYLLLFPTYPDRIQRLNKATTINVDDSESEDEEDDEEEESDEDQSSESDSSEVD
jgi:DNA-directed RNA polymerase subunit N